MGRGPTGNGRSVGGLRPCTPFGGNLTGVEAAALTWFGKHAKDLTLPEAALIAGLPQSPSRLRPDRHPERARKRRGYVLKRMAVCGFISQQELEEALLHPVRIHPDGKTLTKPFSNPQWTNYLSENYPDAARLETTLDRDTQRIAEAALRGAIVRLRPRGVTNGAVVVIENESSAVRGMAGSADLFSQVDRFT